MKTEQETETNTPPPTNGETAAVEESRRVRPKWLVPLVAGLCALALVVAGGIGWKIWSDRRLAEAKAACATASDAARGAMNDWNTLVNGDAADLLEVKADQVKDAKTIDALKTALDVEAPEYEGCVADGKDGLETAIDELDDAAAWYEKAVDAVNDSKLAKTIDTAKTLLESSNGNVQDDKTREELSKAIEAKDEAAIAKASKAVNDSIAAKRKADEEAKAKAQAEADAKAAEEAAAAANAQTQQQQYNYQQSQPQQSWTPSYPYGGGSTGGGSGTTGGSTGGSAGSSYGGSFGYSSSDNFGGARPGGTCPESVCGV